MLDPPLVPLPPEVDVELAPLVAPAESEVPPGDPLPVEAPMLEPPDPVAATPPMHPSGETVPTSITPKNSPRLIWDVVMG